MIDVREVAEILSISTRSVWRLVASGELPQPIRFGRNVRWRLADVEAWIDARAKINLNGNPRHPR
jgi:excisionase family DNA binding protein